MGRLRKWLATLFSAQRDEPEAEIHSIGDNKESITFNGYTIEARKHPDKIYFEIFIKGHRITIGTIYKDRSEHTGTITLLGSHPDYRLRAFLREYASNHFHPNKEKKQ